MLNILANATQTAPVPNDVKWWVIALFITAGAAVLSTGIDQMVKNWFDLGWVKPRVVMFTEVLSSSIATVAGAVAGYRVWDMWLGAVCGLLGGFASLWVMKRLNIFLKKKGWGVDPPKEENQEK